MTPTEKWQAVRAALLVTAMLMWWLPNGAQPTGSVSRLVQPLAGRQGGSAAFAVASGASQASAQTTCKGRYRFPSASLKAGRETAGALRAPSILAGLHWGGHRSATDRGQPLGLSQSYQC